MLSSSTGRRRIMSDRDSYLPSNNTMGHTYAAELRCWVLRGAVDICMIISCSASGYCNSLLPTLVGNHGITIRAKGYIRATFLNQLQYYLDGALQKAKDSLKSLKRTIRDADNDDNPVSKRILSMSLLKPRLFTLLFEHGPTGRLTSIAKGAAWKYQSDDLKPIKATSKMAKACRAAGTSYFRKNPADENNYFRFCP